MEASSRWRGRLATAQRVVAATLAELPAELRSAAGAVPVLYEPKPSRALVNDGLDADLLGLFVGDPRAEDGAQASVPPQILLFLDNLWDYVDGDAEVFEEEVRTTYLHELGHYLGLDELDLEERGLE